MNAVIIEKKGVLVTWAMPEGFIQTSYQGENLKNKTTARSLIYRQFEVQYAKQGTIAQSIHWLSLTTLGPQTGITLVRWGIYFKRNLMFPEMRISVTVFHLSILSPFSKIPKNTLCEYVRLA